jgi:hypothetical protein
MSVLQNLLAIVAKDTGGTAITALQNFQSAVDQTSDVQEVVAAGVQLEGQLVLALPQVESSLIKDTVNLLVPDAVAGITKLQQQAAAPSSSAPIAPAAASSGAATA